MEAFFLLGELSSTTGSASRSSFHSFFSSSLDARVASDPLAERENRMADSDFATRQPGYLRAYFDPSTLRGYKAKNQGLPVWLDYWLYGPPAVRDSSPGVMAFIFGRTEHDTVYNPKKKNPIVRAFNALCLIAMYIFFCYLPFHRIYFDGVKPFKEAGVEATGSTVVCKAAFLGACQPGCEKSGLFGLDCRPSKA